MKLWLIWIGAALGAGVLVFFLLASLTSEPVSASTFSMRTSGSTGEGDVQIDLTPQIVAGRLVVEMAVNTHSVDLSAIDLSQSVRLIEDGREHRPIAAPALSGHHSGGRLEFGIAPRGPFTVVITGVPLTQTREFSW